MNAVSTIRIIVFAGVLCLFSISSLWGIAVGQILEQYLEIPSTLSPVGSGARALGMGGAFIAVADDATAASWNPGGLIQLEKPEVSIVGEAFHRIEDLYFERQRGGSGEQSVSEMRLNYLSAAYPFACLGRNMVVSLNYQHLFDFTREWEYDYSSDFNVRAHRHSRQEGGLYAYGLAYSVQIIPELSLGVTLNLWEDGLYDNGWEQRHEEITSRRVGNGILKQRAFREDWFSFSGFNANVGLLWAVTERLSLGAVYKTPFTGRLKHEFTNQDGRSVDRSFFYEHLDMPMSYGLGVAYRFSDNLTVSADISRTEWDDFILTQWDGRTLSAISGQPAEESDVDPTTQVRFGAEYLIIKPKIIIPLRAGLFYDPAPAEHHPDDYFGFSLGSGIALGRFIFDIAYQGRFGNDVGGSILQQSGFSEDLQEHKLYLSLIVHL